ncbi:Nickel uptake substrate-specific transmembrane region [Enhygromyxa salina]|uniref:Nickel uptake substrate-specific transmembrane region n=1 Tax=Enhygromyxa salina TaxID=215803 RepID=A0A2S9XC73_9BACT|nr:carboxypeptidase regulatory-like domain-containing protein [Enhygromyxa salina]PRP90455.1 Nickel uptake substrate-specific transmembrane region [Enhygromyxa salina]
MKYRARASLWVAAVIALVLVLGLGWRLRSDSHEADSSPGAEGVDARTADPFAGSPPTSTAKLDLARAPRATIRGTIHDPDGRPIADAQVCARASDDALRGLDDRRHRCVHSGPDGRYQIEGLFPVETRVHASAATFIPGRWERQVSIGLRRVQLKLRAGETTEHVDIELEPGGVLLRGVIKDIAGGEVEGAQVAVEAGWLNRRGGGTAVGLSDERGGFELWVAPGDAFVHAFADGYAEGLVEASAPNELVELFLTPESVMVGKVVLASSGEPVADVTVDAGFKRGAEQAARTDSEGRFRIKQLQPGTYKPWAESDQLYGRAVEQVHLGLGETSDEVVIRVHPAHRVDGRVVVAGSDAPCSLGSVTLTSDAGERRQASTDEDGHVALRGLLAGAYEVSVRCRGYVSEPEYPTLVVGEDERAAVVWEVREGLSIRGEVVDERGEPVEAVAVSAAPILDPEGARQQTTRGNGRSQADGQFELAGLLPGRYEVRVPGWRARPGPLDPITVELEPGADVNDLRIVMPAVGGIRGRIVDGSGTPVAGAQLSASLIGGSSNAASRSNDAGEFEFSELRPGPTRVVAQDGDLGGVAMRKPGTGDDDLQGEVVEVIAEEVVELVLTVESRDGRITGVVRDEGGGPVADAFIDVQRMSESAGANPVAARSRILWSWGSQPVLTDQDGRFELDGLPKGKFIVRANRKGGGDAIVEDVAVGSHIELVITPTGELAGTVELADGSAPETFSIAVRDRAAGLFLHDSYFRTEGAWRLREVPAGRYEITATAGSGTASLEPALELGEGEVREDIDLHLSSRLSLRGRLVDLETREPVAGLEVHVYGNGRYAFRPSAGERLHVSDSDGRFEIKNAPAGRVTLAVWSHGPRNGPGKYHGLRRAMTLDPEPAAQDLGEIEVVAHRLERNQDAGDIGFGINRWDPSADPEGFEATVAAVRPGGPADGSGLAPGDVIEKVDGHSVLGVDGGRFSSLTTVPAGTELSLELRGGDSVVIVAGPPLR